MLKQEANGINWTVDDSHPVPLAFEPDVAVIRSSQRALGLVVEAHHQSTAFPVWQGEGGARHGSGRSTPEITNLRRQGRLALCGPLSNPEAAVGSSKCNHGVSSVGLLPFDTPTAQLYSSRAGNLTTVAGGCPSVAVTRRYWSTFCGHGCWQAVLTLWFKFDVRLDDVIQYAGYCMARTPPPLSRTLFQRLQQAFGNTVAEYIVQWKRIWWILCSVCISTLWIQRNRVVHERQQLHFWVVSKSFSLTDFGNYERYRRESAERYRQGCKASGYGSVLSY
ncbi:uncharacterized protein CCR75_003562 [Bremia lactucae]|uniref:Uncharacterized protein n=1 Tax=Bremia lactucae TaxID=4779 RepID=A0A976IEB8_BRELC|nr:hypothetical protein CCR75_003562 [Bremia lactucae]